MTTNFLNNDNQTSLLFKRFQNVVQTGIDEGFGETQFSAEGARSLKNVFNNTIFRNDVDSSLNPIYYCKALTLGSPGSPDISSAEWDSSTNNIFDQSYAGYPIPGNPDLTYYKDIYLKPVQGTLNAWFFPTTTADTTDVNLLKNMIPFNYNPIYKDAFTPIVKFYNSSSSSWTEQGQNDTTGLNWLVDYESGVLELYQKTSILENAPYQLNLNATDEFGRLRISCICYTGPMGITGSGSGGSGLINVGDISNDIVGNTLDVSAIYFDTGGFDVSLNPTEKTAIITNKGGSGSGGGGIADLSYNLFNIPLAPTDGSGYLNENLGTGTIVLKWTNPVNYQAALPFGKYTTYPNGTSDISLVDIDRLPFHRHLNIEYLQYSGGIPDNSANLNSSWVDLSINNPNPKQTVLPNTLTEAYLISNDGSSTVDLCGNPNDVNNAPYERVSFSLLELGKGYQFRIYLDNRGTTDPNGYPVTDPLYGQDVSWNYLYIPDSSFNYIELGSFGPAIAPDDAEITNSSYNEFDVKLSTTNNADASLNTPFPINVNLNLEYAFGIGISGEFDVSSQQMPNDRYDTLYPGNYPFNISDISSGFQRQNSVTLDYTVLESDLSACPQFKYTLNNLYGVNNAFPNDLSYNLDISDTKILPKPSRTEAILSINSEWQNTLTSNSEVNNDAIVINNQTGYVSDLSANPAVPNALIANTLSVTFLENSSNYDGEVLNNIPNGDKFVANNLSDNLIGIDSSGYQCSYLHASVLNASAVQDASGNPTTGYLDVSYSDLSNSDFLIQSKVFEAGKTPNFQNHGYYTGLNITNLTINNINLSKYPDISNNTNYDPYEFRIQHYYNNPATVGGTINWDTSGNYKFKKFYIGKRPDGPIQYTLNGYNNPSPSPNNYLMGLRRPNPTFPILIDYSYNLFDINPTWASPTITSIGGLSKSTLYYEPSSLGTGQSVGSSYISTYPGDGTTTSKDIIPGLQISSGFYTTTQKYSRTYSTGPQFAISGEHINNVSYSPDPSTIPQQDISFGVLNERLWWDYTWGGTGSLPTDLPSGFFSTTPSSPIVFIKANGYNGWDASLNYNHVISITDKQLMWANSNFVGVADVTSPANYPYIDFSSNYYNPNGELLNYSDFNLNGLSGESFSQTYTSTPAQNNFWNQTQGSNTTVNRVLKYITFNIECPFRDAFEDYSIGTSQDFIYQLTLTDSQGNNIDHDTSVTSNSEGYWVFHNEKNTTATATFGPFDGQKLWTTATTTAPGSGSYVQNTGTANDGYKIAFPSQTTGIKSILQISIGLPSDLAKSIKTVDIIFKAV